jgi:hypothetical protein
VLDKLHIYANLYFIWKGGEMMGQITIYLDSETEKKMINTVKKSGKSKSKWVAELIREKTAGSWPENIINLAGAWSDLPTAEEIRKNMGRDMKRESI